MTNVQTMDPIVITDPDADRYHTFGYISWWKQEVVRNATILVVGAGALGNEVLKNLTLMGVGNLIVADFDTIEDGNLSRSVLFRATDRGRRKVDAAAERIKELNPDVNVQTWHGDINFEMGLGVFRHVDAIIGCLDNREARLSINRFSWAIGRPWVDGAIQELMGIVRVFWPGRGACYECTLTDRDYQMINLRYSCPLLARQNVLQGKVPTTPTSASIVAAFQTQEALKLIHGMDVQPGKAMMINGLTNDVYTTEYPVKEHCMSHSQLNPIVPLPQATAAKTTVGELLTAVRTHMGADATIQLRGELVLGIDCPTCATHTPIFKQMARLNDNMLTCETCGEKRSLQLTHHIRGDEETSFLNRTLAEIDVAPLSIVAGRQNNEYTYFELSGDRALFIGLNHLP